MKRCPNGHDVADKSNYCFECETSVPYIRKPYCKNGHRNVGNHRWCSQCEARIPIVESHGYVSLDDSDLDDPDNESVSISFDKAKYLGGLPELDREIWGTLIFDMQCVSVESQEILQWGNCNGLVVDSEQVAKSKIGPALAFGILGAVTAKGMTSETYLTARRKDGALAYFTIDKLNSHEVKAMISSLLNDLGIPILNDLTEAAIRETDFISGMERLAALRDSGHLDDEEFKMLKARHLANSAE